MVVTRRLVVYSHAMRSRTRRLGSWLALASFVAGVLLPASVVRHGPDDPDAAWGAPGLAAGHPVTQVEPVRPPVPQDHCAICHWVRALTHSVAGVPLRGPQLDVVRAVSSPTVCDVEFDIAAGSPARAPPLPV
jgi:hypothetical protein